MDMTHVRETFYVIIDREGIYKNLSIFFNIFWGLEGL